jgi:hypothetical protein
MIFILLCLLGAALIVWGVMGIWNLAETSFGAILGSVLLVLFGVPTAFGVVYGITYLTSLATPAHVSNETEADLRAVALDSGLEGRFFLATGYVEGKRVVNYIAEHDGGYITVEQVDAVNTYVYEDENVNPRVVTKQWQASEWWLAPFGIDRGNTYVFHIPEGSVLENYTIDNTGGQ